MRAAPSPLARPGRAVGPAGPLPRPTLAGQTCMAHAAGLAPKAPRPALGRRAGAQRAAARRATLFSAKTRASPSSSSSPTSSSRPAHEVLGVRPGAPPAEVRAAWVALIREAHPDAVGGAGGGGGDAGATAAAATARAAELNAAYAALGGGGRSAGGAAAAAAAASAAAAPDPFAWQATPADADPAATIPFVDPFAVGVDPMAWRALQALARGEGGGGGGGSVAGGGGPPGEGGPSAAAPPSSGPFDPEAALAAARLRVPPGGVAWLTPAQAAEVEAVMAGMEALSYEPPFASAVLADLLARAAAVNRGGRPPAY